MTAAGEWWTGRRDALSQHIADELGFWGIERLDDPGVAELAEILALAARATADHQAAAPSTIRRLECAAAEVAAADRFRGALLPVLIRHLRAAGSALTHARLMHLADHHGQEVPVTG